MEQRRANGILEHNLDIKLRDALRFKREAIKYDDLDKKVIEDIKNGANSRNAYNDSELRNRIIELEEFKKSETEANAIRINTSKQVEAIASGLINTFSDQLEEKFKGKIDKKAGAVEEHMLSRDLILKINRLENPEDSDFAIRSKKNAEKIGNLEDELTDLKKVIHDATYTLDNNTYKKSNKISESDLTLSMLTKLNKAGTVDPGTLEMSAFTAETALKINAALSLIQDPAFQYVQHLEATLKPQIEGRVLYSTFQGPQAKQVLAHNAIAFKDKTEYDKRVQKVLSGQDETFKLPIGDTRDLSTFEYLVYMGTDPIENGEFYKHELPNGAWTKQKDRITDYFCGQFLCNHADQELYFMATTQGHVTVIPYGANDGSGKVAISTTPLRATDRKTALQTINANSSWSMNINDAVKSVYKVLAKDNDSSSRTYNKFINSEAVLTVAYEDNKITVYNDAPNAVQIMVVYGEI